jgi:Dyp-type peroxidase family
VNNATNSSSQRGLGYFPAYAVYATYHLREQSPDLRQRWQELARELDEMCAAGGYRAAVILGVGFGLWTAWSGSLGTPLPVNMGDLTVLQQRSHVFGCSGGDLWFHIKSSHECDTEAARALIDERLADVTSASLVVPAHKRHGGKVLGGRFIDGLENPADHEDLDERVLIGDDDPAHRGAAFLITQKFVHDWTKLDALTEAQKQNMIGRDHDDRLIPMDDDSSHIKRVRRIDGENVNRRVLRQALPYGYHLPSSLPAMPARPRHSTRSLRGSSATSPASCRISCSRPPAARQGPTGTCPPSPSAACPRARATPK